MKYYTENAQSITTWWLIRHATIHEMGNKIYGQYDCDADVDYDKILLQNLATKLPKNAPCILSDLKRTEQTANALMAHGWNAGEVYKDKSLREQHFGNWQGLEHSEIEKTDANIYRRFWLTPAYKSPPQGESFADLYARSTKAFHEWNQKFSGQDIVHVSHGGVIKSLLALALDCPLESSFRISVLNCALSKIEVYNYGDDIIYRVKLMNCLFN